MEWRPARVFDAEYRDENGTCDVWIDHPVQGQYRVVDCMRDPANDTLLISRSGTEFIQIRYMTHWAYSPLPPEHS